MVMLCEQHSASRLDDETVDPSMWRQVKLVLTRSDASRVDVELLRSLDWFHEHGVQLGETVFLNMPEMGACGPAEVLAIDACPALEQGPGRLITGTFRHTAAVVYDLKIDAESEPIGVTGSHPFWSVDRGNWVAVTDLQIGERLRTLEGLAKVESLTKRPKPEPVYNIEVEGDHCYRVGQSGVLVHNQSAPPQGQKFGCERPSGQGRIEPCSSGTLNTSIGHCPSGYQAHHLIPCSLRNSPALRRAAALGFDINGAFNGWCLPSDVSEATAKRLPLHRGRHVSGSGADPNYFSCVKSLLDGLDREVQSGMANDCNLCNKVQLIIKGIKTALKKHRIWLQHDDRNKSKSWNCPGYPMPPSMKE